MKADSLTGRDLFGKQVRYVIPTFQRPYVWTKDDQWEPFWEDVQYAAERYLEELGDAPIDDAEAAAKALKRCGRHFLGAVVVKQRLTATSQVETREVIDGQQRLATLQLLLDATEEVATARGWEDLAFQLEELTRNDSRYARKDPDLVFKLWPTTTDQDAFRAAMDNTLPSGNFRSSKIVKAHEYFQFRVRDWVEQNDDFGSATSRGAALVTALVGLLEVVVIDLGASDDAFVIFETLNARGTPLLASDLVKNYLLQTASGRGLSADQVSDKYWKQFDDDWWRREVRQGRLKRPRIDIFLDYWLEARTGEEVASHEVFPTFKDLVDEESRSVEVVAQDMNANADVYRTIHELDRFTRDGTFLYRWEQLDTRVLTPLLLWVFRWPPDQLPPERRTRLLVHLESYLIRRMVLRLTTKQYNRTFLEVLKLLIASGPARADEVVIDYLSKAQGDSTKWPTDRDLQYAFRELPVYKLLTRGRVRTVLEALEDDRRGPKSEDQFVTRGKLTIEHIMPQTWQNHWPIEQSVDPTGAELQREKLIQSFGNLTLATSSLNSTMSNHSWKEKRSHLEENSVLHLNREILAQVPSEGVWSEEAIAVRADRLYEQARAIWPRP